MRFNHAPKNVIQHSGLVQPIGLVKGVAKILYFDSLTFAIVVLNHS